MERKKKNIWLLPLGLLFLCDPAVAGLDLLPDAVGFLLLYVALHRPSMIQKEFVSNRRAAKRCALIWLLVTFAYVFLASSFLGTPDAQLNPYEKPTYSLTLHFAVLVLQLILVLPFLTDFVDNLAIYANAVGKGDFSETADKDKYKKRLIFCMIFRSVCALLPELTVLAAMEYDAENPLFPFNMLPYRGMFRILFGVAAGVVFILFAVRTVRFFKAYADCLDDGKIDACFRDKEARYPDFQFRELCSSAFSLIILATVFLCALQIDDSPVLYTVVATLIAAAVIAMLGKRLTSAKWFWAAFGVTLCVNVVYLVLNAKYLSYYLPESAFYQSEAYAAYLPVRVFGVAEVVLDTLLLGGLYYHTAAIAVKRVRVVYDGQSEASERFTAKTRKGLKRTCVFPLVLLALSGIANAVSVWIAVLYPWMWLVSIGTAVLSAAFLSRCYDNLAYEVFAYAEE